MFKDSIEYLITACGLLFCGGTERQSDLMASSRVPETRVLWITKQVTLGILINISMPQFSHLLGGGITVYFVRGHKDSLSHVSVGCYCGRIFWGFSSRSITIKLIVLLLDLCIIVQRIHPMVEYKKNSTTALPWHVPHRAAHVRVNFSIEKQCLQFHSICPWVFQLGV